MLWRGQYPNRIATGEEIERWSICLLGYESKRLIRELFKRQEMKRMTWDEMKLNGGELIWISFVNNERRVGRFIRYTNEEKTSMLVELEESYGGGQIDVQKNEVFALFEV